MRGNTLSPCGANRHPSYDLLMWTDGITRRKPIARAGAAGTALTAGVAGFASVGGPIEAPIAWAIQSRPGTDKSPNRHGIGRARGWTRAVEGRGSQWDPAGVDVEGTGCFACGAEVPPGTNCCIGCGEPV
jgi:hypothetical protein